MPDPPPGSVEQGCREYFIALLNLVYDCYIRFGPMIDPQQRYTADVFASMGKTIEDAEAELGYPRGWTDIGDPKALPHRFELLRRQAGGCGINDIFQNYLGKATPVPTPLPNYHPPG